MDKALLLLFLTGLPVAAIAQDIVLGTITIPYIKVVYVLVMGLWGAMAALLQRLARGVDTTKWKVAAVRDLVNATLASLLAFLACQHFQVPPALEVICYTLAGYGGARFMEFIYQRFIWKIKNVVETTGGTANQSKAD